MTLAYSIAHIKHLIRDNEELHHRVPGSVLLLAVSKTQPASIIEEAYRLGISEFGENYYQEALEKITQLRHLPHINWHFIGPIQSNKSKGIATHFNWVHSINRYSIAQQLNQHRNEHAPRLNVCLQINVVPEPGKSGIPYEKAYELARQVASLPRLHLRGLMTIPPPQTNAMAQYQLFLRLATLLNSLNTQLGLTMDTLSMGMSDDFIPAIQAGATIVRIGTALFGER